MADDSKPFRIRVIETRTYEYEVWARGLEEARDKGSEIWRKAATVGQWEVDGTEYEYEATEIKHETGALIHADQ